MVTKREIYAVIAAYGLGRVLPKGSTTKAAKLTVRSIARPLLAAGIGLARRHPGVAIGTGLVAAHELGYLDPVYERAKPIKKKAMSKFNRAVKKGMSIVKDSTSYGRKGVISSPKKAFGAVTKTVSKANKRQKAPKKGILKKVYTAAAKLVQVGMRGQKIGVGRGTTAIRKKTKKKKDYRDYDPQG